MYSSGGFVTYADKVISKNYGGRGKLIPFGKGIILRNYSDSSFYYHDGFWDYINIPITEDELIIQSEKITFIQKNHLVQRHINSFGKVNDDEIFNFQLEFTPWQVFSDNDGSLYLTYEKKIYRFDTNKLQLVQVYEYGN